MIEINQIGNQEIITNPTNGDDHVGEITAKHPTTYMLWLLQREDVLKDNYYDNYTYDFGAKYDDGRANYALSHELLKKS